MTSTFDGLSGLSLEEKRKLLAELLAKSDQAAPRLFPLAAGQKALWLLHQQEPEGAAYNTPFALRIRSEVDPQTLWRAFEMLAERHASLRATFSATRDGQLLQTIHPTLKPELEHIDARQLGPEELYAKVVDVYRRPFVLERGPLLRAALFTVAPDDHVLLITVHHIVYDGWSAGIIQRELSELYIALSKGKRPALPQVSGTYSDFVARQTEMLANSTGRAHWDYWKAQLSGQLPFLSLPTDRSRAASCGNRSGACPLRLSPELTAGTKALAQRGQATPFVVLLCAYAALLSRLARQTDILIGSPTVGRLGVSFHDVVGYFANPVALRADLSGSPSADTMIGRLREVVWGALEHQDFPFAALVERLDVERRPGVSPLFQASMTFQSSREGGGAMDLWASAEESARIRWGHIELEPYPIRDIEGQFDLTLEMWEARGVFAGAFRYNRALFDESTIQHWQGYFETLLRGMVRAPESPIEALALADELAPIERLQERSAAGAGETTITARFEAQVSRTPHAAALSFGNASLSYAELNARANVVAHALIARGVEPESLVGVCVERSAELVVAILGVLKAGGAYVPLDPHSPRERLALILEDAEVAVLITETKRAGEAGDGRAPTLCIDTLCWDDGARTPNPRPSLTPQHAAYVIYTSGSTGKPNGVIVTHANATRLFTTTEGLFDFGEKDVWTLFHSAAFDFSVWELWGPLFYGGRLVVVPRWMTRSPEAFADLIAKEGVTVLNQTPSAFRALCRTPSIADGTAGRSLRWIVFGGEALDAATVRPWFQAYPSGAAALVNMYGITETTVHVTYHRITEADLASSASPIGSPLPDLELRLLDDHGEPVPVRVPGEIYVGGAGVARGYLKRPGLTEKRFIADPLDPTRRLYRSGDLAIRQPDGTYHYLGRIDDQVKIRGFRIELGEIQSLLMEHPAVAETFVQTFDRGDDDRRIVAYVVPKKGASETVLTPVTGASVCDAHIEQWSELYDGLYKRSGAEKFDPTFNIAGWNSSYTGAPLSSEAMKEWVDGTVQQILCRAPASVLEIGFGSGLLLTRIAPSTRTYVGTDISSVAVELGDTYARHTPALQHARLFRAAAHELDQLPLEELRFEAVLCNSVVQYFPSAEYLARVIESAVARILPGGFLFLGDVRNLRLLEAFHASVHLAQTSGTLDARAFKARVARRVAAEEELVLDPSFFWSLRRRIPRISHVEVRPRRGACLNELTRFRYDVVLHIDSRPRPAPEVVWCPGNLTLAELRARLSNPALPCLGLRGIRNARVQAAVEAACYLDEPDTAKARSVERLRLRVLDRDSAAPIDEPELGLAPEELYELADALCLDVVLDWSRGGSDGAFDAVFIRPGVVAPAVGSTAPLSRRLPGSAQRTSPPIAYFGEAPEILPEAQLANDPLYGQLERRLESELRKKAQERLPDYMVPASIVMVGKLPLTENGKVDKRALPMPVPQDLEKAYVDPRTGEEEILASIFSELLGAERVGVHDSFFDLGGHSLLATQVVSRIRTVFGVELPLMTFFDQPTVAALAVAVGKLRRRPAAVSSELLSAKERPAALPLSSAQERLWVLDRIQDTQAPLYVVPLVLRLRGPLDREALEKSLNFIVQRHEVLRTSFPMSENGAVQAISVGIRITLPLSELERLDTASEADILDLARAQAGIEVSRPFDLARGPLLRARLYRISEGDHVFVLTLHHIVSDGWSIGVLASELSASYCAYRSGREPVLPPLPIQYADFTLWQRRLIDEGGLQESLSAIQQRLLGAPLSLDLPSDHVRPRNPSFRGAVVRFSIDRALTTRLKELSRREGVTLYMTLLAGFALYLSRISGQKEMVLGSPVANRNRAATEQLIGFFVNTLPLRLDLTSDPTFLELVRRVRQTTLEAYADQDVPFERIVEALSPERSLNRQPLVQVMFALQNAPWAPPTLDGLNVAVVDLDAITSKYDLTLSMQESADGLRALIEYSTELFERDRIERMARHLPVLLKDAVEHATRKAGELALLDAAEAEQIAAWSKGEELSATAGSVIARFEKHVERDPGAVALECGHERVSYAELQQRANRLARHLMALGIGIGKRVAIALPRSIEQIVAVLGAWKAHAAYVPIDPDYPRARIEYMLADAQCELLISNRSVADRVAFSGATVWLDDGIPTLHEPATLPAVDLAAAAYVIYTSGSTGRPKGAVLEHRGLANIAAKQEQLLELSPESVVLRFASFSFDASVWELVMALGSGGRLVLSTDDTQHAGEGLARLLRDKRVSHVLLPPSTLAALPVQPYPELRTVISGGEVCSRELASKWSTGAWRFYNAYGPTESTICATLERVEPGESGLPSIGRPLPNVIVRILDSQLRPVPMGVPGELCIGGTGVGRGYLALESLTAECFVADPLADGARLYRTGDLGCWRADGKIAFFGRRDHQVKLRGYRIELGEIESILDAHPGVQQSLVLVRDNQLVGWVTTEPGLSLTSAMLRQHAAGRLPEYMVPTQVVLLEAFPLTPNGKIDRARLPAPESGLAQTAFAAPGTATEELLTRIWAEVLKRDRIGIHDNFFALGGDSILALQIIARATQHGLRLRPRQLFQHQTIAELAGAAVNAREISAEQGLVSGAVPLTPIQRWFFEQNRAENQHFNMAILLDVDPAIQFALMKQALDAVELHHDALRLRFRRSDDGWLQEHAAPSGVPFGEWTLGADEDPSPLLTELHRGMDLERGPLLRAALIRIGSRVCLALVAHHLVVDAVSWAPILEDLLTAYDELGKGGPLSLPPKTTSFAEWSRRLGAYAEIPELASEVEFWLAAADRDDSLALLTQASDSTDLVGDAATVTAWIDSERTLALLTEVPDAYDVRVNEVLIAALARSLTAATGHGSVRLDIEGHGREFLFDDVDTSRTVGWFTTLFPLRLRVGANEGPRETLARAKATVRAVPRGGIGYGILRHIARDPVIRSRFDALPSADVAFNYLGQVGAIPPNGVVRGTCAEGLGPLHSPRAVRTHRIEVGASIEGEGAARRLRIHWTFGSRLFARETIERLSSGLLANLCALIDGRAQPEAAVRVAADFPAARLSAKDLARVLGKSKQPR